MTDSFRRKVKAPRKSCHVMCMCMYVPCCMGLSKTYMGFMEALATRNRFIIIK